MKTILLSVLTVTVIALAGCSVAPSKYTYVVDPDLSEQADNLTRTSAHTGHVVWVNPPMKRIAKDEQK